MIEKWALTLGGYAIAATMLWLYVDAKSDLKAEIESCNVRVATLAVDAEREAGIARRKALERQIAELEAINAAQTKAIGIAAQAATEAARQPERVAIAVEEAKDENACLGELVPDSVIDGLRD